MEELLLGGLLALSLAAWAAYSLYSRLTQGSSAILALQRLQNFADSTPDAVYGIDLEGRCTSCNRACLRLLGYEEATQLLGKDMHSQVFAKAGDPPGAGELVAAMRAGNNLHIAECLAQRPDGLSVAVECQSSLVLEKNMPVGASVTLTDITASKVAQGALKRDHESLEIQVRELSQHSEEMALFGQLAEMLQACVNAQELCSIVAVFAKDLFPQNSGALYILNPAQLNLDAMVAWGEPPPPDIAAFAPKDCWSIRRGKPHYQEDPHENIFCAHVPPPLPGFTFCLPLVGLEGPLGMLHLRARASGQTMSKPRQLVAIALAYQAALGLANLKLKEILREEATRDPVTGLFNRRYMTESLEREIQRAQRSGTSVGLIAFDLDHFKEVNDTLGHAAGDSLLLGLARLTKNSFRAADICCRQGGDEFLVILPDITESNTLTLAESLRKGAEQYTREQFPSLAGRISLSAGLAIFPQDASTAAGLQKTADRALYRAKALGRNQVFAARHLEALDSADPRDHSGGEKLRVAT